jgi:ubiquinone biosynthesis monooxygenase Coq7
VERQFSPIDRAINIMDQALRLSSGMAPDPARPNPAGTMAESELDDETRNAEVKAEMNSAALDEIDHLAWCEQRLSELGSHTSFFNPLWYAGSFAIGAVAGLAGDGWSLGFVKETEIQVEAHLDDHLQQLPDNDQRSQAILDQMKTDEAKHAEMAAHAGAFELAQPVKDAMSFTSKIMKAVAYRV